MSVCRLSLLALLLVHCDSPRSAPIAAARAAGSPPLPAPPATHSVEFTDQSIDRGPFQSVHVWAPPPNSAGKYPALLLLHGNQVGLPDPTWLIQLGTLPEFREKILIVPSLAEEGYEWGNPTSARALSALVEKVARQYPVDRSAIYLVGYSAGASRVLSVAHHLKAPLAGIIAVAGDILRPLRDRPDALTEFQSIPILLVCMTEDPGPHTRCQLNQANLALLRKRGLRRTSLQRLGGNHQLNFSALAPLIDQWMRAGRAEQVHAAGVVD